MKQVGFLFGLILITAGCAGAQATSGASWLLGSPFSAALAATSTASTPSSDMPAATAPAAPNAPEPQQPGDVQSVYQKYPFQLYGGFSFVHLSENSAGASNRGGLEISTSYYYKDSFFGVEGDLNATWGTAIGRSGDLAIASGGPRFRWSGPRGIEYWGHGLVGGANLTPRTALGSQSAFAYRVGGGADLNFSNHWSVRAGADMLGTHFFNRYQYSPLITAGLVFKF